MKRKFLMICLSAATIYGVPALCANNTGAQERREHGAHVHGAGTLAIAFDGTKGKIEFLGAAEGVLGFEHRAKTPGDKKILAEAENQFEHNISKMVQFDQKLKCQFTKELIGQVPEKGEEKSDLHSDWAAHFTVNCAKTPSGTKLIIDFTNIKQLHDLDITVLVGEIQKSAVYKAAPVTIELK